MLITPSHPVVHYTANYIRYTWCTVIQSVSEISLNKIENLLGSGTRYHICGDEDSGSMATALGTLQAFYSNEEDWKSYIQQAKLYFIPNHIKDFATTKSHYTHLQWTEDFME